MESQVLKVQQLANALQISRALAYRLCLEGKIPSIRFGRTVRVRQEDLEKFIADNLTTKNTECNQSNICQGK
jgi:excisionase family DNA binding protein